MNIPQNERFYHSLRNCENHPTKIYRENNISVILKLIMS